MSTHKSTKVKILSKEFQVACPEGSETQLLEAAYYLDEKMREIRNNRRVTGIERIAIMAALNISHELLTHRLQKEEYIQTVSDQIEKLQDKLDEALTNTVSD